jgi:hypothetical protein
LRIGNLEVYGIIYKIVNKINNKVYIGQTIRPFNIRYQRKGEGIERVYKYHITLRNYNGSENEHLLRSIEKYGFSNFDIIENFDYGINKEELNEKEIYWINYYNSTDNNYGYNHTKGGHNISDSILIPIVQLSKNGQFIKQWSSISEAMYELKINHITTCCKGRIKSSGGFRWMYLEDYVKLKDNLPEVKYSKKVLQFSIYGDLIREWESLKEISKHYNVSERSICGCCRNEFNTVCGYLWRYKDDYEKNINIVKPVDLVTKSVVKLSLNGDFVTKYDSITDAASSENGFTANISACCRKKKKSCYGFMWVYEEDYLANKNIKYEAKISPKPKKIVQMNINNDIVKIWDKIKDAKEYLKICDLHRCLKGERKTAGGYKWMYYEDYIKLHNLEQDDKNLAV